MTPTPLFPIEKHTVEFGPDTGKTFVTIKVPGDASADEVRLCIKSIPEDWQEHEVRVLVGDGPGPDEIAAAMALDKKITASPRGLSPLSDMLAGLAMQEQANNSAHRKAYDGMASKVFKPYRTPKKNKSADKLCPGCGANVGKGKDGRRCKLCRADKEGAVSYKWFCSGCNIRVEDGAVECGECAQRLDNAS